MGKLITVVGGQFGSEGKGAVAGKLAAEVERDLVAVRVAGPNAGHTVYDQYGRKFVLQSLPVAAVTNRSAKLIIAPGSEVSIDILDREISLLESAGIPVASRLFVDEQATVLTDEHGLLETKGQPHGEAGLTQRVGSTGKGIGAARASRAMREAETWGNRSWGTYSTPELIAEYMRQGATCLIEGTQGYGLGLHAGYYPTCTSSDCRAIDFMAMAGVSPWAPYVSEVENWVVCRTYPIRVAGNSGPMFKETSWARLHEVTDGYIPAEGELTTVTKKVRRVGEWDDELVRKAVAANGENVKVALTFLDYVFPEVANKKLLTDATDKYVMALARSIDAPIEMFGTGPATYFTVEEAALEAGAAV